MKQRMAIPGFRTVPKTGVIYVTSRAQDCGFSPKDPLWANLGQGAPEIGDLKDQLSMPSPLELQDSTKEYSPVQGLLALREDVAQLYNTLYRKGMSSQYTAHNVAICSGGRLALTRLAAAIGEVNVGHFLPDYTAYEELLNIFKAFTPIPILLSEEDRYRITIERLREEVLGRGLSALLLSNPCNPTGQHIRGNDLKQWVNLMRETQCTCIFDEFYSHYLYDHHSTQTVSAAAYVDDVDLDPIVIVDGLTKNWRLPGWRICWTLGPRTVIEAVTSSGSFLDGGASHPLQEATIPLLAPHAVLERARVLQEHFGQKKKYVLERLEAMGIRVDVPPQGSFYCWANVQGLPAPLNDGMGLFEAGLQEHVITVPGEFFDVNPGRRRRTSRYEQYSRISFGPSFAILERGMNALERMIQHSRRASRVM